MEESTVHVARLNIHSGITAIARSFILPEVPMKKIYPMLRVTIGTEVVAAEIFGSLILGNWRTGEMVHILLDHVSSP